jgi:putative hemolysin
MPLSAGLIAGSVPPSTLGLGHALPAAGPVHMRAGSEPHADRHGRLGRHAANVEARPGQGRLQVAWAASEADVRACQRLRHRVFVGEMGARLTVPPGTPAGHDVDLYDAHCEHLMVRDLDAGGPEGLVVGTYRVLTPWASRQTGGLYTENEFDLTRLRPLRPRMAELGRSCVHEAYRSGAVILALWGALGEFMQQHGLDTMVGCASIGMRDGGHAAAGIWRQLKESHLAPIERQVRPRLPLPVDELRSAAVVELPPLIKGYLRCGAKVLGAPAWDPHFNTADLPMLIDLADLPARYRRHFMGSSAG